MRPRATAFKGIIAALIVAALAAIPGLLLPAALTAAQSGTSLVIDVKTQGNSPSALGEPDFCVSVDEGDEIDVDIVVYDVQDLLSWEATLIHDRSVLEIVEQDVRMFIASQPGSNPLDASEPLPDANGRHLLAVGDVSNSTDSGSGVLGRIHFKAIGEGISQISIPQRDINNDGRTDEGAQLTQKGGVPIGDTNGDRFFDGPVTPAFVAVGASCEELTPVPTTPAAGAPGGGTPQPTSGAGSGAAATSAPSPDGPQIGDPTDDTEPGSGTGAAGDEPDQTDAPDGVGGPAAGSDPGGDSGGGDGLPTWLLIALAGGIVAAGGAAILAYRRVSGGAD